MGDQAALTAEVMLARANRWAQLGCVLTLPIAAASLIWPNGRGLPTPANLTLEASEAPELFALIQKVQTYLGTPVTDVVTLGDTSTVCCIPQGRKNQLVLGLPLLLSASKAEMAALITHELAQLSTKLEPRAVRVHLARLSWRWVAEWVKQLPILARIPLEPLLGGFARRYIAISAGVEKAGIFAADRRSAEIAGLVNTGSAIKRLALTDCYLADFWRRIAEAPVTTVQPAGNPYLDLADELPRLTEWEKASGTLAEALAKSGSSDPAHPILSERLDALGLTPSLPGATTGSAAKLLGLALPRALDHFDAAWRTSVARTWSKAYDQLSPETRRLLELDALAKSRPLGLAPAIERAQLAHLATGLEAARGRFADLIEWHPNDGRAALAAGVALVRGSRQAEGTECLRHALALAPRTDWAKTNAEDWFAAGEALLTSNEDLGIDCLEQAMRIDPACADMAAFLVDQHFDGNSSAISAA